MHDLGRQLSIPSLAHPCLTSSQLIIRTIILRRQLLRHLSTLVTLDARQLILHISVDWIIWVVFWFWLADVRVAVLAVDGPLAGGLAVLT